MDEYNQEVNDNREENEAIVQFDTGLTDLPLEIIVQCFNYLSLPDKYNASLSCHLLNEAFNHPLLWRTQELLILTDFTYYQSHYYHERSDTLPNRTTLLVSKFGKYFQVLTITVVGDITSMQAWTPVLLELGKQCRLEKLVLNVGKMTTARDQLWGPPPMQGLVVLLSFIENAFRMKSLDIKSWPIFPQTMEMEDRNIFKAIMRNDKLKDLEHLDLFWPYRRQMWSERTPVLPDCTMLLNLIQHLSNLKELGLRSNMLSNTLIEELSNTRRSKLNLLKIFVTYAKEDVEFQIPDIRSSSWKRLITANPKARVECHIMPRVPNFELSNLLSPNCPLSKIVFLQWSRIDSQLIESLSSKFRTTLKTLICYCDINDVDGSLVKMAEECTLLDSLVVKTNTMNGIHRNTVVKLASIRGSEWKMFRFGEMDISYVNKPDHDIPEDQVITRNEKGEHIMVRMQNYNIEPVGIKREQNRKVLKEQLCKILGSKFVSRNQIFI